MSTENETQEKSIREIIGEAVGEASMCWDPLPTGVFDSERASRVVDKILSAFHLRVGMGATRWVDLVMQNAELERKLESVKQIISAITKYNIKDEACYLASQALREIEKQNEK